MRTSRGACSSLSHKSSDGFDGVYTHWSQTDLGGEVDATSSEGPRADVDVAANA